MFPHPTIRVITLHVSARSASPDHGPNREAIELEDDVFLSPNKNDRKIDSALLITNKEEALECYRRMIEVNIDISVS